MALKHSMTRFLSRLWKLFGPSTPPDAPATVVPQLPEQLGGDEFVGRFIFSARHLMKGAEAGRPKPQAFKPECFEGNWELSVCRNTGLSHGRLWEIAMTCRAPMEAIARADVGMDIVHSQQLMARYAAGDYPEHSVVIGWSPTGEKDANMMQMVALAAASYPSFPPKPQ